MIAPATIADANGHADTLADGLMSVADAARFLAMGRSTLYQAMDAGRLVYVKFGRARRIPKRALLAFAAANMQGGWAVEPNSELGCQSQPYGT